MDLFGLKSYTNNNLIMNNRFVQFVMKIIKKFIVLHCNVIINFINNVLMNGIFKKIHVLVVDK
jgi:hypothetical protein